jgi:hypothetical protein
VSITVGPLATDATLHGTYLIALNGFKNGNPYILAGSFVTDGNGNITSGVLDYNDGSGEPNDPTQCRNNTICPIAQVIQSSSSYDLSSGNGLGTLTLNTLDNSQNPHTYQFSIAVSGTGASCVAGRAFSSCGRVIETDSQTYGSGVLKVQDPAVFTIDAFFPGNFALLVSGTDPNGNRYAGAGALATNPGTRVDIDCNGNGWNLPACPLDTNDNGNGGIGTTLPNSYGGTFSADLNSTTGRGNFVSMVFATDPQGLCLGSHNGHYNCGYAFYVINYTEMLLISSDPTNVSGAPHANLVLWSFFRQKSSATGWGVNSLNPVSVMELTAKDGSKADVTSGLLASDQQGNGTFASDENDGGTLSQVAAAPGTIALGAAGNNTGQFMLDGFPQFGTGGAVMYMFSGVSANGGYVVGTDAKVTSGVMEPQVAPPPGTSFTNSSVNGNYGGGTATPAIAAVTNSATYLHSDGAGNMVGAQHTSGPGGGGTNNLALTYQVDATGRGVVLNPNHTQFGFFYVIGPGKFAMVPTGTAPALNILANGQPD